MLAASCRFSSDQADAFPVVFPPARFFVAQSWTIWPTVWIQAGNYREMPSKVAITRKEMMKIPRFADFWRAFYRLNLLSGEEKCHLWQRFKKLLKRQAPMISFRSWRRNMIPWLATCTFRRVVGENSRLKTISVWKGRGQRCLFF